MSESNKSNKQLTVKEVGERLGCSSTTVSKLIREQGLPAVDISLGNGSKARFRVSEQDLETWLESRKKKIQPAPKKSKRLNIKEYV